MVFLAFMIRTTAASILKRVRIAQLNLIVHVFSVFFDLILSLVHFGLSLGLGDGQDFDTNEIGLEFVIEAVDVVV